MDVSATVLKMYVCKDYDGDYPDEYGNALELLTKDRFQEAFEEFKDLAEKGDKVALCSLGQFYENAMFENLPKAAQCYKAAAEQGHAPSQTYYGLLLSNGRGVSKNPEKAMYWHNEAANQGFPKAFHNIALLFEQGLGVPRDLNKAITYMKRAADEEDNKEEPGLNFGELGRLYLLQGEREEAQQAFTEAVRRDPTWSLLIVYGFYNGQLTKLTEQELQHWVEVAKERGFDAHLSQVIPVGGQKITIRETSSCFVATATYGTPFAPQVIVLQRFRDDVLLKNEMGKLLVAFYYFVSPPVAGAIRNRQWAKVLVRTILLDPIVRILRLFKSAQQ